ncbi:MAG: hypothetical protein ACT4OY_07845 [Alphaproteobacteria bacterium]
MAKREFHNPPKDPDFSESEVYYYGLRLDEGKYVDLFSHALWVACLPHAGDAHSLRYELKTITFGDGYDTAPGHIRLLGDRLEKGEADPIAFEILKKLFEERDCSEFMETYPERYTSLLELKKVFYKISSFESMQHNPVLAM